MKQLRLLHPSIFAILRCSLVSVTTAAVLGLFLAAPVAATGADAVATSAGAVTSGATAAPAGVQKLSFENGLLTVTAKDAELHALLEAIGAKAGVAFHVDRAVQGKVSASFEGKSLGEALELILGQVDSGNFLTGYDAAQTVREIWILPKGKDATVAEEDLRLRRWNEEDKKYLKEKYRSLPAAVWEVFGKIYGKGRWDPEDWSPALDRPLALSGPWPLAEQILASQESALAYGLSFIRTYENLLRTHVEDLRLIPDRTERNERGFMFVFEQFLGDVPVERGLVALGIRRDRFYLNNFVFPNVQVPTVPGFTAEEATAKAIALNESRFREWRKHAYFPERYEQAEEEFKQPRQPAKLVVLPLAVPEEGRPKFERYTYHLAYKVPFLLRDYFLDAQTGALLHWRGTIKHLTATVTGEVYDDNTESNAQVRGLENLDVRLNGTAISDYTTASAPQAGASAGQTGGVPNAGPSEGANAQVAGASSSPSSADAGIPEVTFQDGLLSVSAERADLVGLLGKVSKAAGVPIEIHEGVSGSVTIFFARLAPEEAVTRILDAAGSKNVLATFEAPTPGSGAGSTLLKISVLRQASGAAAPQDPRRFDFETNREALKRYIEARYGKGALREEIVGRNKTFDTITFFSFYDPGVSSRVTEANARRYAEEKLREFSTFLSLSPECLNIQGMSTHPREMVLSYNQVVSSIPVENTSSAITIDKAKDGPRSDLVYISQAFHPWIEISTTPNLTLEQAAQRGEEEHRRTFSAWNFMLDQKRYEDAETELKTPRHPPELVILPQGAPERDPTKYDYYLAYKVTYLPRTYYIDAHNGQVIRTISHVQRSTAAIRGEAYPSGAGPPAPQPLRSLNVMRNSVLEHTDSSGNYTYNTGDTVSVMLKSTYPAERQFVTLDDSGAEWPAHTQSGDFTFVALPGETTDAAHGYRPNVYYWADQAYSRFQALGTLVNRSDQALVIKTNQNISELGLTLGNTVVRFRQDLTNTPASSIYPDVVLHELSHAGVYAWRGTDIGVGDEHAAISEGLADYFACRIAGDSMYFQGENNTRTYDLDTIPGVGERKPVDINGDSIVTPEEWEYYVNGMVVASILWDLTKETTPNYTTDAVLWDSVVTARLTNSRPETLYASLRERTADAALLWNTFSAHGMNLVVRPASTGGISLDWFQHYGFGFSGYKVYRNETGSFVETDLVAQVNSITTTSWIDVGPFQDLSHRYHYAVRAVGGGSPSGLSNSASAIPEPPGGDPPGPPSNFTGAEMLQGSTPYVQLQWDASSGGNLSEYLIERSIFADFRAAPETVNLHVPATQLSKADYGPPEGFAVDTAYYYRIWAVDQAGNPSDDWEPMNPASVIPRRVAPAAPWDLSSRTGSGTIHLEWKAPTENADGSIPLADLDGYRLYYDTDSAEPPFEGTGAEEGNSPIWIPRGGSVMTYNLTDLPVNDETRQYYHVAVVAVDTVGNESALGAFPASWPRMARWVQKSPGAGQYATISVALSGAPKGTTIMVGPGVYAETSLKIGIREFGLDSWNITVESERGPGETVIDGASAPGSMLIEVADECEVIGFTIRNVRTAGSQRAIDCVFGEDVLIANNVFIANDVGLAAGGLATDGSVTQVVTNLATI